MKKYVFTVDEAVCAAHGKDPNAVELLQVMKSYGTVEEQHEEVTLSEDEITVLRTLRNVKAQSKAETDEKIARLEATIIGMKTEKENLGKRIAEMFG